MADAKKNGKDDKKPIIKKVKKVSGGGHHGGAWKVAYADFVTAMMAFFLLLWLLSTSSKATLEGIAEFFTPTIGIKNSQGIGFKGGLAPTEKGTAKGTLTQPGVVVGRSPSGMVAENPDAMSPSDARQEDNLFRQGASAMQQAFSQDPQMQQYIDNISIEQTPEGLKIDLMDSDKYAMFAPQTALLTEHGKAVLAQINRIIDKMPNYMAITGHTDGSPVESGGRGYSNWELSSDRAQAARRYLMQVGMEPERPKKVVGMADKELLLPSEPRSPRNRRISIIMLRGSHILLPDRAGLRPAARDIMRAPLETPKLTAEDIRSAMPQDADR